MEGWLLTDGPLPDEESEDESTPASSPPAPVARRKFEDEEDDDEVLESWDAAEDSEEEREKARKAAAAKAAAEVEAAKNKKSKSQRIEEHREANRRRREAGQDEEEESEDEDETTKRARLKAQEKDSDLKHAVDLFGDIGVNKNRSAAKPVTVEDPNDSANKIDLSNLSLFSPSTREEFAALRDTLTPLLTANAKKAQYPLFLTEFVKSIAKDMQSEQIKKVASALTTLSNEKMKEEKAAEKGGKKTKAAKTKASANLDKGGALRADTTAYDDGLSE